MMIRRAVRRIDGDWHDRQGHLSIWRLPEAAPSHYTGSGNRQFLNHWFLHLNVAIRRNEMDEFVGMAWPRHADSLGWILSAEHSEQSLRVTTPVLFRHPVPETGRD